MVAQYAPRIAGKPAASIEQHDGVGIRMAQALGADLAHMDATEVERTRVRPDLLALAKERAEAVQAALVEAGIEATRISVDVKAGDEPVDSSGTEIGMSKNRRVEVELVK